MNKIPLSASSTLKNIAANSIMATAFANNTGKTGTAAPVLIAVESDGTIGASAFAEALPTKGGQGTAAQARLVVNAIAGVLSDLVSEYGAITVNTPFGRVDTFIAGSLEYATDPADPDVNIPFLGIVPGADVMKAFSQMEAFVPSKACPAALKRIRDVATADHAIHGTNPFYAQGYGMTYGSTGEKVKLLNALTRAEVCTVSVDSLTKSESQLKCTLPGNVVIPAGTYILQVLTLAGGGSLGGTLWPLELKVNVAQAVYPIPTVTSVATDGKSGVAIGAAFAANGTNLRYNTGDSVTVKWTEGSTPKSQTIVPTATTATKISFAAVSALESVPVDTELTFEFEIDETRIVTPTSLVA